MRFSGRGDVAVNFNQMQPPQRSNETDAEGEPRVVCRSLNSWISRENV